MQPCLPITAASKDQQFLLILNNSKPTEVNGTVHTSSKCLQKKQLCQNDCRQKVNSGLLTYQSDVRLPMASNKSAKSCSTTNVQPVDRAVPSNSSTDIQKSWLSFTESNLDCCLQLRPEFYVLFHFKLWCRKRSFILHTKKRNFSVALRKKKKKSYFILSIYIRFRFLLKLP